MRRLDISPFLSLLVLLLTLFPLSICLAATDLCKQYAVEEEYDKAIEECTKQIKGEIPVRYLEYSYSNRGAAYAKKGQYDKAISDYTRAIELDPGYAVAYYNRAIARTNKKQYDEAISDFSKVIELNPKDSAAYAGRATALAEKKMYDQAIMDFTMAIELNPKDSAAYHNRAMVYARKKQFAQAVSDRDKAKELSVEVPPASVQEKPPPANHEREANYHVQLGVFKKKNGAAALVKKFQKKGYDAFIMQDRKGRTLRYRVLIGRFEDRHGSEKFAAKIRKKERVATTIFLE